MLNTNNSISFKASFATDLPDKENTTTQEVAKRFDSNIEKWEKAKRTSMDIITYMNSLSAQTKLERMPENDVICFTPVEEADGMGPEIIDLSMCYIPSENGRSHEEYREIMQNVPPFQVGKEGFDPKKIESWLDSISEYFKK